MTLVSLVSCNSLNPLLLVLTFSGVFGAQLSWVIFYSAPFLVGYPQENFLFLCWLQLLTIHCWVILKITESVTHQLLNSQILITYLDDWNFS